MSTHALIAILRPDASIRSVYLHSDGYLSWAGTRLHRSFNTKAKASKLISMGGISTLGDEIGEKHGVGTSFYARDRSEELEIEHHANFEIFDTYSMDWEFTYFFNGEKWLAWSVDHPAAEPLLQALTRDRITS